MKCPGQDSQYWTDNAIYEVECPKCGAAVEFYKDDTTRKCHKCQHRFVNPKMDFGCAAYCQFAEQCIGDLPEEFVAGQESLLKDKVAVEMKRFFKTDFHRIGRAARTARYVEQISQAEGGNTPVLLCCAYLQEMADSLTEKDASNSPTELADATLSKLKASPPMIESVVAMLNAESQSAPSVNGDQAILSDARTLSRIEELFKTDPDGTAATVGETVASLNTPSARKLGHDFIMKMGIA